MKKVLLTGASGFIGRQCLEPLLEKGFEVFAISRNRLPQEKGIIWKKLDLAKNEEVASFIHQVKPEYLLHLAWYTKHGSYWNASENFDSVSQSLQLLKIFAESGGKRVVMAGSCAEYDWKNKVCKEEEGTLESQALYGCCKSALHQMAQKFAHLHKLSFAWARIFFLFGPYEQKERLIPSIISAFLQKTPFICKQGELSRDFLHVEDVAKAFVALLDSPIEGAVNIASGKNWKIQQIVQMIAEKMGTEELVLFGEDKSTNLPLEMIAQADRLKQEVKWEPSLELSEALDRTIAWWKNFYREEFK